MKFTPQSIKDVILIEPTIHGDDRGCFIETFGQHVAVELTAVNKNQLFVPHGFVVLSKSATLAYKVDNYYEPEHDRGIAFDDKELKINWQLSAEELQLSDKDKIHPSLANAKDLSE